MTEKKRILVIADSPLVPSGVGTQTKYMIEAMLKTGEFKFFCLAGAIRHESYQRQLVAPYKEDWIIQPVNGYGDAPTVRKIIQEFKPDALWFMTDPRFYVWLWDLSSEIRKNIPMIYYHVWDNYPYPYFNKKYYDSNDVICTISKVTDDIIKTVSPDVKSIRIPHSVNTDIFSKKDNNSRNEIRSKIDKNHEGKTFFFWNNRNARRKQSGSLIYWFKDFLDIVGHDKASLIMHTEPHDPNGQDLVAIVEHLGLTDRQVAFSTVKMPPEDLAAVYSAIDCTINISDAEGFGLATLESLATETPIIVTMTGGLQEQITDGENFFGIPLEPASKAIIGSQDVPYIYEDRLNGQDVTNALLKFHNMPKEEREHMGQMGRKHVLENYGFSQYSGMWYQVFKELFDECGSWENRKNYKHWSFKEL